MDVNNLDEFLEARGFGEKKFWQVEKATYKYTDCGAWCREVEGGLEVGSIVEGVEAETESHTLLYPSKISKFWDDLQSVEDEALQIWNDNNIEEE